MAHVVKQREEVLKQFYEFQQTKLAQQKEKSTKAHHTREKKESALVSTIDGSIGVT